MDTQPTTNNNMPRPRFFDDDVIWDNAQYYELSKGNMQGIIHPAECAMFIVHGTGEQEWTETAAHLRASLEGIIPNEKSKTKFAAPFIYEGYWANYDNLAATFPTQWQKLNREGEQLFFQRLWAARPFSSKATTEWFLSQLWCLVKQFKLFRSEENLIVWILYLCLLPIAYLVFFIGRTLHSRFLDRYLCDVRLYCNPEGAIENAVVQCIHRRIAERFLNLIGLSPDFTILPRHKLLKVAGKPIPFKRVVWVSHSLGTVISYNVLSELFERADELEQKGNHKQKAGVIHFRNTLKCFITMSCPLDKLAYLPTGKKIIRPWPQNGSRKLLTTDEKWWINLYDLCDPVSGAISNPFVCNGQMPRNLCIMAGLLPFSTHSAYWSNANALKVILQETFSKAHANVPHNARELSEKQAIRALFEQYAFWFVILPFCIGATLYTLF
jgi:hypothetical protein